MVKDKESSSSANSSSAVRGNDTLEAASEHSGTGGGSLRGVLPGNGLPVALHSSSVGKPDRMVWLMIIPESGILGGSKGHTHKNDHLSDDTLLSPPSPSTQKCMIETRR